VKKLVMHLLDNTYFCIGLCCCIFAGWVTYLIKHYSERLQDVRDDRQHYYDSWHDLSERNEKLIGYISELETENFHLRAELAEYKEEVCPPDHLQEPETKQ
jgi:hypothetical protein